MHLSQQEIAQFYRIWYELIWGINEKRSIVPKFDRPVYGEKVDEAPFIAIRQLLWENPEWIDDFIADNDFGNLTEIELRILVDWRKNFIKDRFVIIKHLKKYSVFMTMEEDSTLYGVCGISNPISEVVPYDLPFMVEAVLLPFKDKIIYDSFLGTMNVSFGRGFTSSFKEAYEDAKKTTGIIENMAAPPAPIVPTPKKPKAPKATPPPVDTKGANVPKAMSARYMEVAEIIESFCDEKLSISPDFRELCLKALAKLCHKRPSPLVSGKARTWAAGIAYAIGQQNFIFDKSQDIYMPATEIAGWFGLAKNTAGNKAAEISKLLNLSHYYDSEFTLPSLIEKNPMAYYLFSRL